MKHLHTLGFQASTARQPPPAKETGTELYPIFLDLDTVANKVKKQLDENFAREWGSQYLGRDKQGLYWFVFPTYQMRMEFKVVTHAFLQGFLGLKTQDTDTPTRNLKLLNSNGKIILKSK